MTEEQLKKEDQLFIHLVNTFVQSAWISLGKVKNPVSDTLERNLDQATYYIDLLDMLQTKMKGNLSEWEEQYIIHSLSELKLNFIDEQKKVPDSSEEESENSKDKNVEVENTESDDKEKSKGKKRPKVKKKDAKSPKMDKNKKKD